MLANLTEPLTIEGSGRALCDPVVAVSISRSQSLLRAASNEGPKGATHCCRISMTYLCGHLKEAFAGQSCKHLRDTQRLYVEVPRYTQYYQGCACACQVTLVQ